MNKNYSSIQPPKLFGIRYRYIFLFLQVSNAIRYYICPEEYDFKMPHFTSVTLLIIMLSNAFSFFHGLDGNKHNWEVVQKCLVSLIRGLNSIL